MHSVASPSCITPLPRSSCHIALWPDASVDLLPWRHDPETQIIARKAYRSIVHVAPIVNSKLELSDRANGKSSRQASVGATRGRKGRVAPLELLSSEGQLLIQMLQNGEDISAAACTELERLCAEQQRANTYDNERKPLNDEGLYRRIAHLKEKERSVAVEDIMYALVVGRMVEADVSMLATMAAPACCQKTDFDPEHDKSLEALHSPEVQGMIHEHVSMVIRGKDASTDVDFNPHEFTQISKLKLGKIYAASVMYGYFVSKVYQRFVLERRLRSIDHNRRVEDYVGEVLEKEVVRGDLARMRVVESVQVIERHVEALFGRPPPPPNVMLDVKLGVVKSQVLEALALGGILREVESYITFLYPLSFRD